MTVGAERERSVHHLDHDSRRAGAEPFLRPSFSRTNRLARGAWMLVESTVFRFSPRAFFGWRRLLLRVFGAKLGERCHIHRRVRIWAPWNLHCEDLVTLADEVVVYNPSLVFLATHSIVSQQAYLCGAGHDYTQPAFPMISAPIRIGAYAWIGARAVVQMGVTVGERSILALGAIATRDIEPWTIYAGVPARKLKDRPPFPAAGGLTPVR